MECAKELYSFTRLLEFCNSYGAEVKRLQELLGTDNFAEFQASVKPKIGPN